MNNNKQQILIDCVNEFKEISRHVRHGAMCIRFLSQQWRYGCAGTVIETIKKWIDESDM